jgi:hypothetical protein
MIHDQIIAKLDQVVSELLSLKASLVDDCPQVPAPIASEPVEEWLDTWQASERFNIPADTVRWLCREKCLGEMRGGRWSVNVALLSTYVGKRDKRD